ncbi:MAG: peptidoglycan-binding protein LysM, partial [Planctomycetota bacterium]
IARKTLNDTSEAAIGKLFNANRDKLENRDSIFEGMKLRIPNS